MNQTSLLRNQITQLLKSVQTHFPKNGQKLVIYLLFYKRYCTLIEQGYITNISSDLIENNLSTASTTSKNGKHVFSTLFNFNTPFFTKLFDYLKEFTTSVKGYNKGVINNYTIKKERKFETILYYLSSIDTDILNISIQEFGMFFKEILLKVYKNEFKENKEFNELLINISQLNGCGVFINNPKSGNIILEILSMLENDYSKIEINEENSFIARMNMIMNGFYSFNFGNQNSSTVIIDDENLHGFENNQIIISLQNSINTLNTNDQLLFTLPTKRISELTFTNELLNNLVSVVKFDKDLGLLIFNKSWNALESNLLIINRLFENELNHDIITIYQKFIQKESIQEDGHFRIEKTKNIERSNYRVELSEKEPKSTIQYLNESIEHLNNHVRNLDKIEAFANKDFESVKMEISEISRHLSKKIILSNFEKNLQWQNLFLFFKNEFKNLTTKRFKVISKFQNLTLLDLKINTNLFRNLLQYIDYHLKKDSKCKIEFDNSMHKKKVKISFYFDSVFLISEHIEQLNLIAEIHNGYLKINERKKNSSKELFHFTIPYNKQLNHRTIEKLVTNNIRERKEIYIISDEIGNENIIRGLNIKDIIIANNQILNDDEKQTIQELRFQSSLEIFFQLNQELTTKRTLFSIELPEDEVMKGYIFQEIEKRNRRYELNKNLITVYLKANSPPSPSKIVEFFNKFHDSQRLKYITHDYDVPNSKFDYDIFLKEAEEEFETIIQTIAVHHNLEVLIREFAFKKPKDRIAEKSNLGWKDDVIKAWCVKNVNRHPINNSEFSNNVFDVFKKKIEIREKYLEYYLNESIKQKLGDLYEKAEINFSEDIEFTTFYTDVEQVLSGIRDLFAPIKERIVKNPHVDISVVDHFENIHSASIELIILHRNSFAEKIEDERILFGSDLSTAKRKLEGFCDWAIESKFKNGFFRLNILNDKEIPKKVAINESRVKGFSHHLTFYI